jgi:DNA-binding MarR family transcriptional regulator
MDNLSLTEYRELARFRFEIRQFLQFSEQAARDHGLEPQQHQALLALKGLPETTPATIGELAGRLLVKHHSAVGLVDRLEKAGLLSRRPNPGDARQVLVQLTHAGETVLRRLSLAHRLELQESGPQLLDALRTILDGRSPEEAQSA